MKEQILKISKDLEQGTIGETEAQNLLLDLFGISCRYTEDNILTAMEYGMNLGEITTVYTDKQFMTLLDICDLHKKLIT